MPMRIPASSQRLLIEQGLVPPNCRSVELHLDPSSVVVLRYDVLVTPDDMAKLAIVFQAMASEGKARQDG